jgi:hypothetical protein
MAVGTSGAAGSEGVLHALAESWDGSSWSALPVPAPGSPSALQGVSCASPTSCKAVGWSSSATAGLPSALLESWDGIGWSVVATPAPPASVDSWLNSVTCGSPTSCVAVGSYSTTGDGDNPDSRTLIESWKGTAWSLDPSPSLGTGGSVLLSAACTSPTACIAVGDYSPTNAPYEADNHSLVESWSGAAWSVVPGAGVANAAQSELASITCSSPTKCVAVGSSTPPAPHGPHSLLESWDGSVWSVVGSPTIDGAFESVACTSPTVCLAVGERSSAVHPTRETLAAWWRDHL